MPPQPGSDRENRDRKWWRFSSDVGAANCTTRTCRGSSGATSRLIAPPFPDASQPSKTTQSGGPDLVGPDQAGQGQAQLCQPLPAAFQCALLVLATERLRQVQFVQTSHGCR